MKLLLIGNPGGTNVADSFRYAAQQLRMEATLIPATSAFRASRLRRSISWHLRGHKPPLLEHFSARVLSDAIAFEPTHIVATGLAPVTAQTLRALEGVRKIAYLTDDPWNPEFSSHWFMDALLQYDVVYTTRRSNLDDLVQHGCREVHYLPFGYDPRHFFWQPRTSELDVFFAGGAEPDRVQYLQPLLAAQKEVVLAGDRWDRYPETRTLYKGHFDPEQLRHYTAAARVNVCLVRGSNRDGHVMRSFEIPASGGCMLVQDTQEHRDIFGADGAAVVYFDSPAMLAARARDLLPDAERRRTLAGTAHALITQGGHTYADRLSVLLKGA